jgi:hypothetical protein
MTEKVAYADHTLIHPIGILLWAAMAFLLLRLRRPHALLPLFVIVCFIPPAQRVTLAGFDFTMVRLLILVGWARILTTGMHRGIRPIALDRVIVAYAAATTLANSVLHGTAGAVVHNMGIAFDLLGVYFLVRAFIRTFEDLEAMASCGSPRSSRSPSSSRPTSSRTGTGSRSSAGSRSSPAPARGRSGRTERSRTRSSPGACGRRCCRSSSRASGRAPTGAGSRSSERCAPSR